MAAASHTRMHSPFAAVRAEARVAGERVASERVAGEPDAAARAAVSVGGTPDRAPEDLPLRALTGYDEELIARRQAERNMARLCNEVLARCLVAPGAEPSDEDLARVRRLLVAERDRALVQLRRLSLGPEVKAELACSQCGAPNELDFSLDALDLGFRVPRSPILCELGGGSSAELALPTAGDQEELVDAALDTAAERRTWLLGRLLRRHGSRTEALDLDFARGLALAERLTLEQALVAALPDFDLQMSVSCSVCQASMLLPFDVQVFFCTS